MTRRAPHPATTDPARVLVGLGARIRAARDARGESRAVLAAHSGVSVRFLAALEAGTANISLLRLHAVARALGADLDALLAGSAGPPDPPDGTRSAIESMLAARTAPELRDIEHWLATRYRDARPARVALLGLRGAGKSTVGRRLARALRVPFHELDVLIERAAGLSLAQIFELQGEPHYRRLERRTLDRFLQEHPSGVLATGGGLVAEPDTYDLLRRHCTTVWLRADPEVHWRRVVRQGDRRPMANNPAAMQELRALLAVRAPLYAQAQIAVDTSGRTPADVTAELVGRIRPRRTPAAGGGTRRAVRTPRGRGRSRPG